jgi:UDP-GlcNAc3NAcA epimerase
MASQLHILTVIGARPQIIKASALGRAIQGPFKGRIRETLLHTGQHYDANMSDVFLHELGMRAPDIALGIGSGSHGEQTARMVQGVEAALRSESPDLLLVYGDTNSTLAGALAAAKLHVPVAHVEAGLRSHHKSMPEEINRVLADHCSTWLFCPTELATHNLAREGFPMWDHGTPGPDHPAVIMCGDVMYDNSLYFAELARTRSTILADLGLKPDGFLLATVHRDHNTDDPQRLAGILGTLLAEHLERNIPVVLPLHPRTRKCLDALPDTPLRERIEATPGFHLVPPVGYFDMIALERNALLVVTDSGGLQKEAHFFGKPCVVLRDRTEWVELVENGVSILADADPDRIHAAIGHFLRSGIPSMDPLYGDGQAARHICAALLG